MCKKVAAAQVYRCVVLLRRQDDFLASELSTRHWKVAKVLANAVSGFWHSIEVLLIKEKAGSSVLEKTQMQGGYSNKDVSEAVPMDVDVPGVEEVSMLGLETYQK